MQTPIIAASRLNQAVELQGEFAERILIGEHKRNLQNSLSRLKMEADIYIVENLDDAREFLRQHEGPVILINQAGSTKYYGMLVLDYIFKKLVEEFPQVVKIFINVESDKAALLTAKKLSYQNILYN